MRTLLSRDEFRHAVAVEMVNLSIKPDDPTSRRPVVAWPLPNVWLGVSVEDQKWANIRIPELLMTPAAVRFLSMEPLLGGVDLTRIAWAKGGGTHLDVVNGRHGVPDTWQAPAERVDWVIVGGESGPGARPMHPDWARSLRDQCTAAGVPFHFKQFGEWRDGSHDPRTEHGPDHIIHRDGRHVLAHEYQTSDLVKGGAGERMGACFISRVGKKAAGRDLDGRTWDQFPAVHA
jgi:protein gp37